MGFRRDLGWVCTQRMLVCAWMLGAGTMFGCAKDLPSAPGTDSGADGSVEEQSDGGGSSEDAARWTDAEVPDKDADSARDAGETDMVDSSVDGSVAMPEPCKSVVCGKHASCSVSHGKTQCSCDTGYDGNGKVCTRNFCEPLASADAPCGANQTCDVATSMTAAACACSAHFDDCDQEPANGCETDLRLAASCGACGVKCAGTLACTDNACEQAAVGLLAGLDTTCALMPPSAAEKVGNRVRCWGRNDSNGLDVRLLGVPDFDAEFSAVGVATATSAVRGISVGPTHSCVILASTDKVSCWGDNGTHELGIDGKVNPGTRVESTLFPGITQVATGSLFTCVVALGVVKCWGNKQFGSLGNDESLNDSTATAVNVQGITGNVKSIRLAAYGGCALTTTGAVYCWGPIGAPSVKAIAQPVVTDDTSTALTGVTQLERGLAPLDSPNFGESLFCALTSNDHMYCWGTASREYVDGLINSNPNNMYKAHLVSGFSDVQQIAVGYSHLCVRSGDSKVRCVGAHADLGALGIGPTDGTSVTTPTEVQDVDDAIDVVANDFHTCIRRATGVVQCWGRNTFGAIGDSTQILRNAPVNVTGLP